MTQRFRWLVCALLVVATLSVRALPGGAAPNDWAEGTGGEDDGATRDFYNRGAVLPWDNANEGDWHDRAGVAQGDDAFALTTVDDTDTPRTIEWDVTELVQAWVNGDVQNQGLVLRAVSGDGPIDFSSREHGTAEQHPRLDVVTADGTWSLDAVADTFLEPSTYRAQGAEDRLRVGGGRNTLLTFDLDAVGSDVVVTSATLRLYTTAQFGTTGVGIFRATPGHEGAPPALQQGLAADYDGDAGIAGHPDVLLYEGFQATDWMDNWTEHGGVYEVVESDPDRGFEPLSGRALRATVPEGENTALNTRYDFQDEVGAEPDEIYLRYYLRLGSSWNQTVDGGKLPGISGTYGEAGWGGRQSDGTNGWSARGLFRETVPDGDNPLGGHTPIGSYVYHADMETQYGDNFLWVDAWGEDGYGGVLDTDRWYCLETFVSMNTPGEYDGVLRAWVDGRLSLERDDLRFRTVDSLHIERIWMNVYHGGTAVSPYDQHLFIDNVVIARSYVGPIGFSGPGDVAPTDTGVDSDASGSDSGQDTGMSGEDVGVIDAGGGQVDAGLNLDAAVVGDDANVDDVAEDALALQEIPSEQEGCECSATRGPSSAGWLILCLCFCLGRRARSRGDKDPAAEVTMRTLQ